MYDNTVTAREYISYIAESAGGFACIGRDGKLYIRDIYQDETEIPLEMFGEYKWGEEFKISKVSYEDGIRSFKFGDETRNNLWINQDNMYIVDEQQVENIYNKVNGLVANSFEGKAVIDPRVDIGDKIIIDGKPIIYQGEMTLEGRFIAQISSKIQIKQKEETTVKKESQKVINRRVQSEINQIDGKITQLVEETSENSQKLTQVEQDIDSITQQVQDIETFTKIVSGVSQLKIENAEKFPIIEFIANGQTREFEYDYPQNDYPQDDYPQGIYAKVTLVVDTRNRASISENAKVFEIDMQEPLYNLDNVCDQLVINANKDKATCTIKVVRYLKVNSNGTITKLAKPAETILYDNLDISLFEGTNYIYLLEYPNWQIEAKYMFKSDMNKYLATKVEMNSKISQTAEEINLEVKKKVDGNEIISSINQSAEEIQINAEKINLSGKELNLADNMSIKSNNFNVDSKGNMTCNNANIDGGKIKIYGGDSNNSNFVVGTRDDTGCTKISASYVWIDGQGQNDAILNIRHNTQGGSNGVIASSHIEGGRVEIGNGTTDNFISLDGINNNLTVWGPVYANSFNNNSKEELKKNITKYNSKVLEKIKETDIYEFNYKTEDDKVKKHIGFIIGNNYNTPEEVISNSGESVDTYAMTSILWQAIKELTEKVEYLENKLKEEK